MKLLVLVRRVSSLFSDGSRFMMCEKPVSRSEEKETPLIFWWSLNCFHYALEGSIAGCSADSVPHSDAACQHSFDGASVGVHKEVGSGLSQFAQVIMVMYIPCLNICVLLKLICALIWFLIMIFYIFFVFLLSFFLHYVKQFILQMCLKSAMKNKNTLFCLA